MRKTANSRHDEALIEILKAWKLFKHDVKKSGKWP